MEKEVHGLDPQSQECGGVDVEVALALSGKSAHASDSTVMRW